MNMETILEFIESVPVEKLGKVEESIRINKKIGEEGIRKHERTEGRKNTLSKPWRRGTS